jgi:hypothetical protein
MRGTISIMQARQAGYKVDNVWICVGLEPTAEPYSAVYDIDQLTLSGFKPEIHIYKTDTISTLDLRCIYNLTVHIIGDDNESIEKVVKVAKKYKPAAIYLPTGEKA